MVNGSIKKFLSIDCVNIYFFKSIVNYLFSMFFGAIPHCLYRDSLTLSDYLSVAFNVHDRTFKRSFIRKNPLTLKLRKQPFRGVILNRCSSSLQINHINLPYETPFLRAHFYGNIQIFQIRSKVTTRRNWETLSF